MVITGMAGSGKTVLAVELILGLLNGRAEDKIRCRYGCRPRCWIPA